MENTLKLFENLSNRSFAGKVRGLIQTGPEQIKLFQTLCANAVIRTIETNDTSHVNKMVEAALACGRYRTFARVIPGVVPFAWDKAERVFSGKRQKGKYVKLMQEDDNGALHFENLLVEYFGKEGEFAKQTPAKSWDLDKAVLALVRRAHKNGKSQTAIINAVERAEKELAA